MKGSSPGHRIAADFARTNDTESEARIAAHKLLASGMPLSLTTHDAKIFLVRAREILASLGPDDSMTKLRLLTAHVVASAQADFDSGAPLAEEAQAVAERIGGPVARAYALLAWCFAHPMPEHAADRATSSKELITAAAEHDVQELIDPGYLMLLVALLERGEIRSIDAELLDRRVAAATGLEQSGFDSADWFQCLRSILDGDTDEAERQATALLRGAQSGGDISLYATHMGMIRWMQGRGDGLEDVLLQARREHPDQTLWTASVAWLWLQQGRRSLAQPLLDSLPDVHRIPRDRHWLATLTILAEVARITGSMEHAGQIQEVLAPFAGYLAHLGVGVAFWGTTARSLGLLEERLGMVEAAREHLQLAIELTAKIGALAWHAEAQIELAEFAIRHNLTDIPAYELLEEARATSEARGFAALIRRSLHKPRIRVLGGFETISLGGVRASWTSRKARDLLKMLVAARGVGTSREVFMDELWPGEDPAKLVNRFSVAVNVVRRALDPDRLQPTQHYVVTEGDSVRLELKNLDIDLEKFLTYAKLPDEVARQAARDLYRGDAFSDDLYSDWAASIRRHAEYVRHSLD